MRSIFPLVSLLLALSSRPLCAVEWVEVGGAGNVADDTGFGSVMVSYEIARFETTNGEYAEFLNAVAAADDNGLYNLSMGSDTTNGGITRTGNAGTFLYTVKSGFANKPVSYVSFYDALRLANWMHNGQPTGMQDAGTTENGAYTITAAGVSQNSIARNAGATIHLPNEDEWYKAAYYADPASYFEYPAGTDTLISCVAPGGAVNTANCDFMANALTEVGSYPASPSPAGSFDQGGNVWEWTEATILGSGRVLRGGSFIDEPFVLGATERIGFLPINEVDSVGVRLARSVPEPEFLLQFLAVVGSLTAIRRGRQRR